MTEEKKLIKVTCEVCGGRGGWHKDAPKHEENWCDCGICDGLGFYEREEAQDAPALTLLIVYASFKKIITESLDGWGKILRYSTLDNGISVEIDILPNDRQEWFTFVKSIIKFSHFSSNIQFKAIQNLFYSQETDKFNYYWTLTVIPREIKNLEIFVDLIKAFKKSA